MLVSVACEAGRRTRVGNYVTDTRPDLRNYMTDDTSTSMKARTPLPGELRDEHTWGITWPVTPRHKHWPDNPTRSAAARPPLEPDDAIGPSARSPRAGQSRHSRSKRASCANALLTNQWILMDVDEGLTLNNLHNRSFRFATDGPSPPTDLKGKELN